MIPNGNSKGKSILRILEHFNLSAEEAIAFGDGFNDREMLQTVGTGIAMGNAAQELKAVADDVCPDTWDEGIYRYCAGQSLI